MEKSSERWWDLPSAAFLFFAILFSTWRLQSTNWVEGLEHVRSVALAGVVIGLALGQSKYQKQAVVFLSLAYMLVVICWQWLDFMDFAEDEIQLGEKLLFLAGRLLLSLSEFTSGRPVQDPLFFVAILSIPYWFSSLYSGYQLTRFANGLAAILPSGILMFVIFLNHYTVKDYSWMFGVYLFITLQLLGRQKYLVDRKKWREKSVQISAESGMDFNNAIMVSAAVLILLVWAVPYTLPVNLQARQAWQKISKTWVSEDERFQDLFASVKMDNPQSQDYYRNELPLGTSISQSETLAFLVYTSPSAQEFPRLYWRARVYDVFEDGRWLTSKVDGKSYEPQDGNFEIPDTNNRKNVNFTFSIYIKGQSILYTAAQPVWISHPANIFHTQIPLEAETDKGEPMDIMILQATPYLEAGETYHSNAMLANPTIPELQAAGQEYPTWVTDKYLQLPADFSPRIKALAFDIAANLDNPYDQAVAITNYLRSEITYTPIMSFPEGTEDQLEYFLFEGRQGFCNYYASSEVLMLRTMGIPARLAVGFAQGEPNLQNAFYTVREKDAHAWPEVYFPGYGWIEFEPSGNQEPVERPLKREERPVVEVEQNNPLELDAIEQEKPQMPVNLDAPKQTILSVQFMRVGILVGVLTLALLFVFLKRWYAPNIQTLRVIKLIVVRSGWETPAWLNAGLNWSAVSPIERAFQSINISLRWMSQLQASHITPAERASVLKRLIPAAATSIEILLNEHQSDLFSPRGGNVSAARRAAWNIIFQTMYARLKIIILGYN
jgi:transglutaminase-like putative cysteine protease